MVTVRDDNRIPDLIEELRYLEQHELRIGLFGDDDEFLVMIASVHEFGAVIYPRRARALRIPFGDGFVFATRVTIPERSFIRAAFDERVHEGEEMARELLGMVMRGEISGREALERWGAWWVGVIQHKIVTLQDPPLSEITIENKESTNPLIDTGRMRQGVTWKVVARA